MMEANLQAQNLPEQLGLVIGLALEPYSRQNLAGHALSAGIVVELYLATKLHALSHDIILRTLYEVKEKYPQVDISCDDYNAFLKSLHNRKIRLLKEDGTFSEPQSVSDDLIIEAIDFYRESYGQ